MDTPGADGSSSLSIAEAAERLGVHYMTAYRYVRTGALDARQSQGQWQIDAEDLKAFQAMREQAPPSAGRRAKGTAAPKGLSRQTAAVADRLVSGDEAGAWRIIQDGMAGGWRPSEVYLDLLAPALVVVGDRWASGTISVADEHQATVVAMRLIGRLGSGRGRRGRTRGTVVLSAVPGDRHAIPTALLADLLRSDGYRVTDLGADTPADALAAAAAAEDRLVGVGMCATAPLDRSGAREVRRAVRLVQERTGRPVLLGGAAIRTAEEARRLGTDHWSPDAEGALTWFHDQAPVSRTRPAASGS